MTTIVIWYEVWVEILEDLGSIYVYIRCQYFNIIIIVSSDIDECENSPCIHGNCTDEINDYSCQCFDGFMGGNCEIGTCTCDSHYNTIKKNCLPTPKYKVMSHDFITMDIAI